MFRPTEGGYLNWHHFPQADIPYQFALDECIGDLAPMQNHQFSSSELPYFKSAVWARWIAALYKTK